MGRSKIATHKDFESDDDEVKQIKKNELKWENRFRTSIAMEYLPNRATESNKNEDSISSSEIEGKMVKNHALDVVSSLSSTLRVMSLQFRYIKRSYMSLKR